MSQLPVHIEFAITRLLRPSAPRVVAAADSDLARKAEVCGKVLAEARRLVRTGSFGAQLGQLVGRACELLDDMDDVLVALHPRRNTGDFVAAAALHRELEQIQAAVSAQRRRVSTATKDSLR